MFSDPLPAMHLAITLVTELVALHNCLVLIVGMDSAWGDVTYPIVFL